MYQHRSPLGWESLTKSLTMDLESLGDNLVLTYVNDRTELDYLADKLELLVVLYMISSKLSAR